MTQTEFDSSDSAPSSPTLVQSQCQCCLDDADIQLIDDGESNKNETKPKSRDVLVRLDGQSECFPGCSACCHRFQHRYCAVGCDSHNNNNNNNIAAQSVPTLLRCTEQTSSASSLTENNNNNDNCLLDHACAHRHDGLRYRAVYRPLTIPATDTTIAEDNQSNNSSVIKSLSVVDRFLSVWIILVMILGVIVGYYSSTAREALDSVQITTVSLPVAFGLWFMMYPVLVKVQYESFGAILRRRDIFAQLGFSLLANWVIGPFIMLAVAWAMLPDLSHYRNGVIMVGLARCIAMVLIWNQLARGDPEYCAILVALNSVLQIILYAPLAIFFLVVVSHQYTGEGESFNLDYWDVFRSVLLFLGVPLAAAILTRFAVIKMAGRDWFERKFVPFISPLALIALLWTVFVIFAIQGHNIIDNIGDVCRVAVPMVVYFILMFTSSLAMCWWFNFGYEKAVTQAFTASSNNFELAIAVAAATFGVNSPEALAATIGPLVEVPVLLALVYVALWLKPKISWDRKPIRTEDGNLAVTSAMSPAAIQLTRCK